MLSKLDQPRLAKAAGLEIAIERLDRRIEAEGISDCRRDRSCLGKCRKPQCSLRIIRERLLAIDRDTCLQCGGHSLRVDMVRRRKHNELGPILITQHLVEMRERATNALIARQPFRFFQVRCRTRNELAVALRTERWDKSGACPISRSDYSATHRAPRAPEKMEILSECREADNIDCPAMSL